jgi:hypothetical protein
MSTDRFVGALFDMGSMHCSHEPISEHTTGVWNCCAALPDAGGKKTIQLTKILLMSATNLRICRLPPRVRNIVVLLRLLLVVLHYPVMREI